MFSPLWHSLLIIALFSLDKALRNFPLFSPSISSLTCTATERIWGLTPESPASWILETVGSEFRHPFRGAEPGTMHKARAWERDASFQWKPSRERQWKSQGGGRGREISLFPHACLSRPSLLFICTEEKMSSLPWTKIAFSPRIPSVPLCGESVARLKQWLRNRENSLMHLNGRLWTSKLTV